MGKEKDNNKLQPEKLLNLLNIGNDEEITDSTLGIIPSIKDYEILEKLGEAGQGQVWKAIHLSTRREIALKVPKFYGFSPRQAFQRFEREVEVISHLDHPNIVKIYDSGIHKGVYFYTMDYIKGRHLDDYVREEHLGRNDIIKLVKKICDVIEFAHSKNVIHRDIKPSNILITKDGEPHILDFGLAKLTSKNRHELTVTMANSSMGTPAYMSPEQASGRFDEIDARSDIYSLGIILYNLITGSLPFDFSGTNDEIIKRVSENRIKSLSKASKLDNELIKIFNHIFQLDPKDRYNSAGQLSEDLDNYLEDNPLLAGSASNWYKSYKYICKHKYPALLFMIVSILACGYFLMIAYTSKFKFVETFDYKQGMPLKDISGWKMLRSTTPPLNHVIVNKHLKESNSSNILIASGIIVHTTENIYLEKKESFRAQFDFYFDGLWMETIGFVFGCQDKGNFYSAEVETNKNQSDRLILVQLKDDTYSEIADVKTDLNKNHIFELRVEYNHINYSVNLQIFDKTLNEIVCEISKIKIKELNKSEFGILTCDANNTFIDNLKITKFPEPVNLHKKLSALTNK